MKTHEIQETLGRATVEQLGHVIDWIARPFAPAQNDALRALFHAARRDPGQKSALIEGLVSEVLALRPNEMRRVARTLGCGEQSASTSDLFRAIATNLGAPPPPARVSLDVDALLAPMIDLAGRVLGAALRNARAPHRRAGGRRRHG